MTESNIEKKIEQAFTRATPENLELILSDCGEQKENGIHTNTAKRKNKIIARITAIAAVFVLMLGTVFAVYSSSHKISTKVSLDVNPSVEMQLNRKDMVIDVVPLNEDGTKIIGDMNFSGSSLDTAVNALIDSMLSAGYLNEYANSILVSVDNNDAEKSEALRQTLTDEISAAIETDSFSGAILSQTISHDGDIDALATQYGISTGKAQLISRILELNPLYSFDSLANLTINELNLFIESEKDKLPQIISTGSTGDKAYIGTETAIEIALAESGAKLNDVFNIYYSCMENGITVCNVEIYFEGYKYRCDINAVTGEIINSDKEPINEDSTMPSAEFFSTADEFKDSIGIETAQKIALSHAGLTLDQIRDYKSNIELKNGTRIYELTFKAGRYEYEYEIDAHTGEIIASYKESD